MYFRYFAVGAAVALLPISSWAATYTQNNLTFETETRQSVWEEGAAAEIAGTEFLGAQWNTQKSVDIITGSQGTVPLPNPALVPYAATVAAGEAAYAANYSAYLVKYGAYQTALGWWYLCWYDCGSKPSKPSKPTPYTAPPAPPNFVYEDFDTRTGLKGTVKSDGKAGIDLNYKISAGSMAADMDYDVQAELPDDYTVKVGEEFSLTTTSNFKSGAVDTQSPTLEASIDAVLKAKATAEGLGCLALIGCTGNEGNPVTIINIDEDRELIGVDLGQVTYLDGFTPPGLELKTDLLNQTVTLQANLTTGGTPALSANPPFDLLLPPKPPGVYIDLASAGLTIPNFHETGGKVGDSLVVNAQSDFLDLRIDLDTLFAGTGILPPGGLSTNVGPFGVSFDAYDFDAGPSLDVFQDITITPQLMVDLKFDKLVEINGQLVESFTGLWDSLPKFKIFDVTEFTPEFFLDALVVSKTGIQAGLDLTMEFLKGSIDLSIFSAQIGPLFAEKLTFDPAFAKFSLFDSEFSLAGLTAFQGESFILKPYETNPGEGPVSAVPLPAGMWLLLSGLIGMLPLRRKRGVHA